MPSWSAFESAKITTKLKKKKFFFWWLPVGIKSGHVWRQKNRWHLLSKKSFSKRIVLHPTIFRRLHSKRTIEIGDASWLYFRVEVFSSFGVPAILTKCFRQNWQFHRKIFSKKQRPRKKKSLFFGLSVKQHYASPGLRKCPQFHGHSESMPIVA